MRALNWFLCGIDVALHCPILQHLAAYWISLNANQNELTSSMMHLVAVSLRSVLRSSSRSSVRQQQTA